MQQQLPDLRRQLGCKRLGYYRYLGYQAVLAPFASNLKRCWRQSKRCIANKPLAGPNSHAIAIAVTSAVIIAVGFTGAFVIALTNAVVIADANSNTAAGASSNCYAQATPDPKESMI